MANEDFDAYVSEVEYLLRKVALIVKKRGRDILSDFDITPPQFNALLVLANNNKLTMGELCRRLYLASSTVTDLIDRMEKNELVIRERDPDDRRVIRLRVREKGHELIKELMATRIGYLKHVLLQVDPEQREHLRDALHSLFTIMTEQKVQRGTALETQKT
jgi:DNA-binding MarR family transcriptional regulator